MHKTWIIILTVIFFASPVSAAKQSGEDYTIVVMGDSLITGFGMRSSKGNFTQHLQKWLKKNLNPDDAITVINRGVNGETSVGGAKRLVSTLDALKHRPDLVILEYGANDVGLKLNTEHTRDAMDAMVQYLDYKGYKVIIAGMTATPRYGKDYNAAFNPIFADIAKKYNVALYPFFLEGIEFKKRYNLPDLMHPNSLGAAYIAKKMGPLVKAELLRDPVKNPIPSVYGE